MVIGSHPHGPRHDSCVRCIQAGDQNLAVTDALVRKVALCKRATIVYALVAGRGGRLITPRSIRSVTILADHGLAVLLAHVLVYPAEDIIRDFEVVSILHQHMAVAVQADLRQLHELRLSAK